MSTLYDNIIGLCNARGIKGGKMCVDLGLSKSLMTDLKAGRKKGVNAETAQKIANYFNVSVGFLLGNEKEKSSSPVGSEHEIGVAYLSLAKELEDNCIDPNDIRKIMDVLKDVRGNDKG